MISQITPYLFQGSFADAKQSGWGYRDHDVVVFCAQELQPDPHAVPPNKTRIRIPFDDTHEVFKIPMRDILKVAEVCAHAINHQRRVLSTCALGLNRSGLVSALTLISAYGLSPKDAVELVRQKRPHALRNTTFVQLVYASAMKKTA